MLTVKEIVKILERDIYATPGESRRVAHIGGIETAAEAIAARLTIAHAAALFTGRRPGCANTFLVPTLGGGTHLITIATEQEWQDAAEPQPGDEYFSEAIGIYLRAEAKC